MKASGLLSEDRDAAVRARQRARTRSQVGRDGRHRKNTDELINEGTCNGVDPLPHVCTHATVTTHTILLFVHVGVTNAVLTSV